MTSYTFSKKSFKPTPPEKGSFPLDHEGLCKVVMLKYMRCLYENKNENTVCRNMAKDYLACRMDNQLMVQEDWSTIGYADQVKET
ncbi:Cytochrome c oxidase assembly protein COX19 [Dufourea novaeangliae]|uniref:Cytochrome c oxidase assembly protein COX19 n=2 Tax=Dufourea novaeangliae TaxID=178035 RepID=A0A154PMQ6_DUFNO|nr:Cytochrome c oxidase assembly protein COX19 [Dufourea novaeangliae]